VQIRVSCHVHRLLLLLQLLLLLLLLAAAGGESEYDAAAPL
jgi:hypothetical protein